MTCAESEILIHALLDGELDAGHAREVEAHLVAPDRRTEATPDHADQNATQRAAFRVARSITAGISGVDSESP
jgi:anti-sigma factor RsiW